MKKLLAIPICALGLTLAAQTVVLEVPQAVDTTEVNYGPNRKFFVQSVYGLGFFAGRSDSSAPYVAGRSYAIRLSSLAKIRWTNFLSNCIELGYQYFEIPFDQTQAKTFPDTSQNRKQKLRGLQIEGNVYQRFNFGRRGDRIGNYIDIGIGANWIPFLANIRKNDLPDGRRQKTIENKLPFKKNLYYTAIAKLGIGGFYVFGQYQLSPWVKDGFGDPEIPALLLGLGFTTG